ncbi:hypothetical protein SAMD00019534_124640 [Acytostelium subglobosum LB1]|uniref:hypothetical protein n=1 Tax=Acytostelium subglobosum LB1 TaxID=1410327 RepID=UPI0006449F24|nr:hypothetical protein SAMD00019534_124640 [Acytostelium subglobosum LB1]GAM29288.1 hypothetical protein SAMD00019534_124640 [Acytostelium subglobosum LB1]|eukprot:XP_012747786.1 hypothetical protein SAMD00019534_124640 [Acytostelium subglobosum LB1]
MDNTAKFYRVLMYPNLYPDWTHLYYGELYLRGHPLSSLNNGDDASGDVYTTQCILAPGSNGHGQLVVLSVALDGEQVRRTYIDTYQFEEMSKSVYGIDNRRPLLSTIRGSSINNLMDRTAFKMVYPQDDYNEIWWHAGTLNQSVHFTSKVIDHTNTQMTDGGLLSKMVVSPDGKTLVYATTHSMYIQRIGHEWAHIVHEPTSSLIKDITFTSSSDRFIIVSANDTSSKLMLYSHVGEGQWQSQVIHMLQQPMLVSAYVGRGGSGNVPIIISVMDDKNTAHICKIVVTSPTMGARLQVRQSFPKIDAGDADNTPLMHFSSSGLLFVVQYPSRNELIVYRRKGYEFSFHSAIDLAPGERAHAVDIFNFRHFYILLSTGGHLNFYQEIAPTVPKMEDAARQNSFYLPPPLTPLHADPADPTDPAILLEFKGLPFTLNPSGLSLTIMLLIGAILVNIGVVIRLTHSAESWLISKALSRLQWLMTPAFYIGVVAIFGLSLFEIVYQSAFTNDWPAHIHHVEQWLNAPSAQKSLDFDYSHFMHYHGPCTYPAGFMYLYTLLYYITGHGSLQVFQLVWAVMESVNFVVIKKLCDRLNLPTILAILPIASNRLHLYNVRVVINDFPSTLLLHVALLLIIDRRYISFSILYSFVVSLKLNYIFYAPAILLIFLRTMPLNSVIINLSLMALVQIILGLPFLMANPVAYISIAYDFSRTLLWEKTRNYKFVGRIMYDSAPFNMILISLLVGTIIIFLFRMWRRISTTHQQQSRDRAIVFVFLFVNFLAITFARGLYTPFLCWYFYTFPIVLYLANYPYVHIILFWIAHEVLFRFFKDLATEMYGTYIYFLINLFVVFSVVVLGRTNIITTAQEPTPQPQSQQTQPQRQRPTQTQTQKNKKKNE